MNRESVKYTISGKEKVNSLGKFGKMDGKSLNALLRFVVKI